MSDILVKFDAVTVSSFQLLLHYISEFFIFIVTNINPLVMKYLRSSFVLIVLVLSLSLSAQVKKDDIDKAIDITSLQHPYLYFTDEEKPALLDRIKNDPESNDIFRQIEAEAQDVAVNARGLGISPFRVKTHGQAGLNMTAIASMPGTTAPTGTMPSTWPSSTR